MLPADSLDTLTIRAVTAAKLYWPHITALGTTTVAATGWWKTRLDIEKTRLEIARLRREARLAAAERSQPILVAATPEDIARYGKLDRLSDRFRALSVLLVAGLTGSTATVALSLGPGMEGSRPQPPAYRVDIVEAPPRPRAMGVPDPRTPTQPAPPAPTPPAPQLPPRAGGGPEGGRGTDVANLSIRGLEFPFPGYLQNIVRQVALRFTAPNGSTALTADVAFLIHRDGSVSNVRIVRRSGNYAFDLEAQGAVEAAGEARAFGSLPEGFHDDVLPVTFSFDSRVMR